jgi:hypothetical protein
MTRTVLSVVLVVLSVIQGLHPECWTTCIDLSDAHGHPACHERSRGERAWSAGHHCGDHTAPAALIGARTEPLAGLGLPATRTHGTLDRSGAGSRPASAATITTDARRPPGSSVTLRI